MTPEQTKCQACNGTGGGESRMGGPEWTCGLCHGTGKPLAPSERVAQANERTCLRIAELPDRTSPDDWPEAMLVTSEELSNIIRDELTSVDYYFAAIRPASAPVSPAPQEDDKALGAGLIGQAIPDVDGTLPRLRLLKDMRRASELCDEMIGPGTYQTRMIALAMIARQYLREIGKG